MTTNILSRGPGRRANVFLGTVLALLGACVATGWLMRSPTLVRLLPHLPPMMLDTALCFVLSGAWVMITAVCPGCRAARFVAAALFAVGAVATVQHLLGVSFGIVALDSHWLQLDSAHTGRMSPLVGIAFVLASIAMMSAAPAARTGSLGRALLFASASGAVGLVAMAGYAFGLNLVYSEYALRPVSLHTAVGLLALSAGLWSHLIREGVAHSWKVPPIPDRITAAAAGILTLVALGVGISVFAVLQGRVEQALRESLAASMRHRLALGLAAIEGGLWRSRTLVGRPAPARLLRQFTERGHDPDVIAQLSSSAESLVRDGYLSVIYFDASGRRVAGAGQALQDPDLEVDLRGQPGSTLAWKGRFVISGRYDLSDAAGTVGRVWLQVPLPALDALSAEASSFGSTGEAGMCARVGQRLGCFPQPRNPHVYHISPASADGALLPMARGLAGETGVTLTTDYRGQNVVAAYGPLGAFGLAMVVKMDTAEVFAPIRERLHVALPILILFIAAGTMLLRISIRNLAAQAAQAERETNDARRSLESMLANVADGIMRLAADGTIRSWNPAAERLFGYRADEIIGRKVSVLVPEDLRQANIAATERFLQDGRSNVIGRPNLNYPARRKDGSRFEMEFTISAIRDSGARELIAVFRDITERKRAERELERRALHDGLTGVANRASLHEHLQEALARSCRSGIPCGLMMLDLDNLKQINDTLGHEAGDQLLVALAERLKHELRPVDFIARFGGDEFTVILEEQKALDGLSVVAEKLLASIRTPFHLGGGTFRASVSIGIALSRADDTPGTLMKRADMALYEAKRAGRDRFHLAS